ncbi:MAG: hypothetical protein JSR46_08825, partial [Verrucomicrobia bacterium]|nr:hypothetical protein [Verrucomicrobiota bacterium]
MNVYSATDKVFQNDNNQETVGHDHSTEEEHLETAHESQAYTLPTIFSLAGG